MNGNCCNLWRGEIKGDIRMESGLFIFHISNCLLFTLSFCLLHQSSGILLAPNFPLPQFGWEEEGRRQKRKFTWNQNSDVRSLRNLVNTSYIHVKQTQHSFNLHIIHHPSAIHEMYCRWSKGREVDICVQTAGTSSCVCCTAVSRRWRCSEGHCEHSWNIQTFCQTKHLVKLWQWIIYHVWLLQRICGIYGHFR